MTDTPLRPFDPQEAIFTSLAFWVAERDGITPDEAAVRLGNLFASDEVQAQVAADQAAAAAKPAAVEDAADQITEILNKLRGLLGL